MASGKQPFFKRRAFHFLLGLSVTLGCLWYAWHDLTRDSEGEGALRQIQIAFSGADYRWLPVMWVVLGLFFWIKAWRWTLLLRPLKRFSTAHVTPAMMIGFAFNNLLPAHLGDIVRVFVFARQENISKTGVLSTVALERVLDVMAILVLLGMGLTFVPMPTDNLRNAAWGVAGVAVLGIMAVIVYLVWTRPFVDFVEGLLVRIRFLPRGFSNKVAGMLEAGADGLSSLKSGRLLAGMVISSLAQWFLNALLVYLSLVSFGIEVPFLVSFIVMGVVAFAVTIPSAPGYFGVLQVSFSMALALFVTDRGAIYAASVYYHLVQWIPVTLIGLWFFHRSGWSVAAVDRETASTDALGLTEPAVGNSA